MNIAIEKRIAKLEAELLPKEMPKLRILFEPGTDADADKWAAYNADLEDARRMREQVIVVCACYKPNRQPRPGMRYVEKEWQAQLAMLASKPSECGNKDRLCDLIKSLPGNVLGVAKATVEEVRGEGEE